MWDLLLINLYCCTQTLSCRPWPSPLLCLSYCCLSTASNQSPILDLGRQCSVFPQPPLTGSCLRKHWETSDSSGTQTHSPRSKVSSSPRFFFSTARSVTAASSPRVHMTRCTESLPCDWPEKKNGVNKQFAITANKVATCPLVKRRPYSTKTNRRTEF